MVDSNDNNKRIFISYAHEDDEAAWRMYSELKQRGLEPWIDKESLLPGQVWRDEISKAIKNSCYFIAILSSNSVEKGGYVRKELKEAFDILEETSYSKIFVIPVRLDDCKVSDRKVNVLHIVDMNDDWKQGFEKVLRAMGIENVTNFDWTNLLLSIRNGECTPLIGPGACKLWIPEANVIANQWTQKYDYPLPDSDQLPRVAQFLAVKEGDDLFPKTQLCNELRKVKLPDFRLDKHKNTPPAVLADLNLPIYITTNYDHSIEEALKSRGGKKPISDFCRWSEDLVEYANDNEINSKLYDRDADYKPTSAEPLVYHLHGDIDHASSMVLTEKDYIDFVIFLNKEEFSKGALPLAIRREIISKKLLFVGYTLNVFGFSLDFSVIFQTVVTSSEARVKKGISVQILIPERYFKEDKVKEYLKQYTDLYTNLDVYWGDPLKFSEELRNTMQI
jgi:TIR domain/SIR2-like domain